MANTYTQIYLNVVFAVSGRAWVISAVRREQLQKYITGIVTHKGQKLIAIHCMPDHTHILIGLKPGIAPSDLIGDIKTGSSNHINKQRWIGCQFSWQEGFGAFSVSHSHLDRVVEYIQDQAMHHRQKSFQQEYVRFLRRHHVPFDHRYILSRSNERGCTCRSYEALFLLHDGATNIALLAELLIGEAAYPLRR